MTITKIKLHPRSTLAAKVRTGFAGSIEPGPGIIVDHTANVYTISVDFAGSSVVTGPVVSTDNAVPRFDGTDGTVLQNSNVLISDAGVMTVSLNAAALPTPPTGTVLHLGNTDAASTRLSLATFGTGVTPIVTFQRSRGTAAAPTAAQTNDELGALTWNPYGATGYSSTGRAVFLAKATENHTDSARGTKFEAYTTPTGADAAAKVLEIGEGGTLSITPTASTYNQGINIEQTGPGGSVPGPQIYNIIDVTHIGEVASTGVPDLVYGLHTHAAHAFRVNMTIDGSLPTLSTAALFMVRDIGDHPMQNELIGGNFCTYSTAVTPLSNIYGGVSYCMLDGVGNKNRIIGHELDVGAAALATVVERVGLGITANSIPGGGVGRQGSAQDTAIAVYNNSGNAAGWQNLIQLDNHGGSNPLHTTGNFFSSRAAYTIANVFSAANVTVTGNILDFPHVGLTGSGILSLNRASVAAPTPFASDITSLNIYSANAIAVLDSSNASGVTAGSYLGLRAHAGNPGSPTALQSNDQIGGIFWTGYGATGYAASGRAGIFVRADQNWTDTAQGTRLGLSTTANGTTTSTERLRVENDGGVTVPSTVTGGSKGSGTINATGLYQGGVQAATLAQLSPFDLVNGRINATVASNALTIAIKTLANADPSATDPVYVTFRNATLATGDQAALAITAATSLVVSSGSTMGTTSSVAFRLWVVGFNDGGTFRLGAVNCWDGNGIFPLDPGTIWSSTAEGGAGGADSAHTIYTGTAASNKPLALLGYLTWNSGLGTAGTWSAAPDVIQLFGSGIKRPGDLIRTRKSSSGAVATGTTTIPADDTIPQSTEGDQYFSVTLTPMSPANPIRHAGVLIGTHSAAGSNALIAALFQDSGANAIAASWQNMIGTNAAFQCLISHLGLPGTASSTTFKLRAGGSAAGTFTLNGAAGGRFMGGVFYSHLLCEELQG